MNIYLAGPMRGYDLYNFPAFFRAALALRAEGHTVWSPAEYDMSQGFNPSEPLDSENNSKVFDLSATLKKDFQIILNGETDTIVLLPGWKKSQGASAEAVVAFYSGVRIMEMIHIPTHEDIQVVMQEFTGRPVVSFEEEVAAK